MLASLAATTNDECASKGSHACNPPSCTFFGFVSSLSVTVRCLVRGLQAIEVPSYDFATHSRRPSCSRIEAKPVVRCGLGARVEPNPSVQILVEGILIFADKALRDLFDIKVSSRLQTAVSAFVRVSKSLADFR